jgi:hypothetical protein
MGIEQLCETKYENVSKKFREQAGTPLFPRDNKLAEWPQAGNGTEA